MATTDATETGNWGRWGEDDERGALNLITPGAVKQAAQAVRTGKVYSLSLPILPAGGPIIEYRGAPKRLTLGSNAYEAITATLRHRLAALERQRELAYSTDAGDIIGARSL